jgi:GNAT superfamily N-acetyltransferase
MEGEGMQIKLAELEPSLYTVKPHFGRDECVGRQAWLAITHGDWCVCEVNGQVVGWVLITWSGKPTHPDHPDLSDLYVAEAWRSQGIGSALLRHMEALAAQRGFTKVGLSVNPERNPRAHRLYTRLGYLHDGGPVYLDGVYNGVEDWVIDLVKVLG